MLEQVELERKGERVTNYMRVLLLVVFGAGTAFGYATGDLKRLIAYFATAVACYALSLAIAFAHLQLKRHFAAVKYICLALELGGLALIQLSYLSVPNDAWTVSVKSPTLYGIYYIIIAEALLRFSPQFTRITAFAAALQHTAVTLAIVYFSPAELGDGGTMLNPMKVSLTDWVLGGVFLLSAGLVLATATQYVRDLVLRAERSEELSRSRLAELETWIDRGRSSARNLNASAGRLDTLSESLTDHSKDQLASIEETTAAMEEMSASIQSISDRAQEQDQLCANGAGASDRLRDNIRQVESLSREASAGGQQTLGRSEQSEEKLKVALENIYRIERGATRVEEIVTVINDISDRTNLLALNAAIEAARAGEEGRGFSVVADEVGKLAELSRRNAGEIEKLLRETKSDTEAGVHSIEAVASDLKGIISGVKSMVRITDRVYELIAAARKSAEDLAGDTGRIQAMARAMRHATGEQLEGVREIQGAANTINESANAFVQAAEDLRRSADELSAAGAEIERQLNQVREAPGAA